MFVFVSPYTNWLVINSTSFLVYTSTNAQAVVGTFTSTIVTNIPVYNISTVGLTKNDKIALGVGIGVGVPCFLAMLLGCLRVARGAPHPNQAPIPPYGEQNDERIGDHNGNNVAGNQDQRQEMGYMPPPVGVVVQQLPPAINQGGY